VIEAVVGVALRAILASVVLGAGLSGLVLVVTRRSALTAATRHALWTTAMIATAVMPLAGIAVSLMRATPAQGAVATWQPVAQVGLPAQRSVQQPRDVQTWTHTAGNPATDARTATTADAPVVTALRRVMLAIAGWTPRVTRALALGVVGVWALGALVGMIGLAASVRRIRGLKRRSSPLDGALADELPWLTATKSGREIYLRLSYEIETPVAVGFGRPVILIPTELAGDRGLATLEPLVLHEHAHLRRYDDWTNLVQRTIERVFWFNPIVWIVGRRIALEREIASDDAVVEKTGEAHAYATSLWRLAREMRMPEHSVVAPGALLTRKQIAVRIEQLLDANRGRLHRSPAAALITACAGIAAIAFVATSAPAVELPARADSAAETAHAATHVQQRMAQTQRPAAHPNVRRVDAERTGTASAATTATKTKIVYVPVPVPAKPVAIASPPAPPARDDAHMSVPAPAVSPLRHVADRAKLSPQAVAAIRAAAARSGTAVASYALSQIGVEVDGVVSKALEHLPAQLAQLDSDEDMHPHRLPPNGAKLSRELISTCMGCSFRNADLRGFDFHGLTLKSDDFGGADLRDANFAGAKLTGVSLRAANLGNSDLRGATLTGVDLRGATLAGARVEDLNLIGVSLRYVGVTGVSMRSLLSHCVGCDLSHLDLHGMDLHGISLTGADLNHTDLRGANLSGAHLTGVDLSGTNLTGADLTNTQLEGCGLRGVVLRDATTTGMTLIGSSLGG
jgi:uncharacterized protein YjbI with pentapeptide repeats/beta-lactamase regulating signal transducer with metallopeptidase domain